MAVWFSSKAVWVLAGQACVGNQQAGGARFVYLFDCCLHTCSLRSSRSSAGFWSSMTASAVDP